MARTVPAPNAIGVQVAKPRTIRWFPLSQQNVFVLSSDSVPAERTNGIGPMVAPVARLATVGLGYVPVSAPPAVPPGDPPPISPHVPLLHPESCPVVVLYRRVATAVQEPVGLLVTWRTPAPPPGPGPTWEKAKAQKKSQAENNRM